MKQATRTLRLLAKVIDLRKLRGSREACELLLGLLDRSLELEGNGDPVDSALVADLHGVAVEAVELELGLLEGQAGMTMRHEGRLALTEAGAVELGLIWSTREAAVIRACKLALCRRGDQ